MPKSPKSVPPKIVIGFDTEYQLDAKTNRNNVLSHQAFLINCDTGREYHVIKHVRPYRGKYVRLSLDEFLVMVFLGALKAGAIATYPRSITLAAHFARADLSMFADFHSRLKRKFSPIRGTYASTVRRLSIKLSTPTGFRRLTIALVDTTLVAPDKSKLEKLGEYVGLDKLEIPLPYSIENMERYRDEQLEAFEGYALRDAEIAARYVVITQQMLEPHVGVRSFPTLGAAGVAMFRRSLSKKDLIAFLGLDDGLDSEKRSRSKPASHLGMLWAHSSGCYHGGLNSIFCVGYSPAGRTVLDVDLRGAYPTAMAAIAWPDWSGARYTKSLDDLAVADAAMTFALVKFKFPPNTKFPCLPVRSSNKHGLLYPLAGESWCCGPELVVALDVGASIEVMDGYRVDWLRLDYPFAGFSQRAAELRKAAKEAGDVLREKLFKQLSNSLYGKVAQGVAAKRPIADDVAEHRVFDAEAGEMTDLPPSSITCPPFAAWVTSLVRAVLCETLHRLPPTAIALMATTDGILFVGDVADLDTSGPLARAMARARARVEGLSDPPIWEVKGCMPRVITLKTRGEIPVVPADWAAPVHLAMAGAHLPDHLQTDVERARFAERFYRERNYDTTFERKEFTPLSEQHRKECDLTSKIVPVKLPWDYDWKNEPVEPVTDVEGVASFATKPWPTICAFEEQRRNSDDWRHNQRRVLRTARDFADMNEWIALRPTRKALRTNARGVMPNLPRAIVVEILRLPWQKRPPLKEIARVFAQATGCHVVEQTIKDIRIKRDEIETAWVYMLTDADIEFARLFGTTPKRIAMLRAAVAPNSIAERQFSKIVWEQQAAPATQLVSLPRDNADDDDEDEDDEGRIRMRAASMRGEPEGAG